MKSNNGRSTKSGFDFDLGLNSSNSRSLNDQKNKTTTSYSSSTFSTPNSSPSWQPNKSAWTHQPAAPSQSTRPGSLNGPSSMVGDIMGKSWASLAPSNTASSGNNIGIANKNPNLFGDLVGPALAQNKSNSNVPLKNVTPASNRSSYSMGGMADTLPKTGNSVKSSSSWGSSGAYNSSNNVNVSNNKNPNLSGPSMLSSGGNGLGGGLKTNKDPFGSLVDFGSKPAAGMNSASKVNTNKTNSGDDGFGDFQKASKSSESAFSSSAFTANNNNLMGSSGGSYSKMGDFGFPTTQNQPPVQSSGVNDFDVLFSSSSASAGDAAKGFDGLGSQQFSGIDDWDTEFGGGNDMGGTTELEGLPPPPAGVTASVAKNKGMDNYKQGQYPDAIKWLSWAVILFGKAADSTGTDEVLSSRASCYKEVGEYKKAVADCTKVLEHDDKNVSVLVQRALLYESMEKYKLGAEDLRTVMKLDPGNRVARSTIHRLNKMAEQ